MKKYKSLFRVCWYIENKIPVGHEGYIQVSIIPVCSMELKKSEKRFYQIEVTDGYRILSAHGVQGWAAAETKAKELLGA